MRFELPELLHDSNYPYCLLFSLLCCFLTVRETGPAWRIEPVSDHSCSCLPVMG